MDHVAVREKALTLLTELVGALNELHEHWRAAADAASLEATQDALGYCQALHVCILDADGSQFVRTDWKGKRSILVELVPIEPSGGPQFGVFATDDDVLAGAGKASAILPESALSPFDRETAQLNLGILQDLAGRPTARTSIPADDADRLPNGCFPPGKGHRGPPGPRPTAD
jgi:hypothetical protein